MNSMKPLLRYIIIRVAVLVIIACSLALMMTTQGCGPLTPHVAVDGKVDGKVDTSGKITVDITTLTAFFLAQCKESLGATATNEEVQQCASTLLTNFLTLATNPPAGG